MHILATPVRKEMEAEDIEDGEILEDESNPGEQTFPNKDEPPEEPTAEQFEVKNSFEKFFHKDKKNHHDHREPHKTSRRERSSFSDVPRKRKRIDSDDVFRNEKYFGKKNERCIDEEDEDDMIFMLGGSARDTERKVKNVKVPIVLDPPDDLLDPPLFNEGENEDPRPYSKRSPSARRDKLKKDRGVVRGINVGLLKRRGGGRGGAILRKDKPRDASNDVCHFFAQGKCQRGSECPYLHSFNHPRKLEVCKFYLNDCCNKRDNCIYMHGDFPCKYFHTPGSTCYLGKNCKFSHAKLDEVQRAVLKKYADVSIKELDEMQRYYREMHASRNNKEKQDNNSIIHIPSLFDIKVSVPFEFRGALSVPLDFRGVEDILNEEEGAEGDGVTTPIPSPQSMVCENTDSEDKPLPANKHHHHRHHHHHHKHKILSEHNDHQQELSENDSDVIKHHHRSGDELSGKSHHKKRSKKSDDHSDGEKSKKHSEKRKKKSKKDDKDGDREKKKKKKERKRSRDELWMTALESDLELLGCKSDSSVHEDSFEIGSEDKSDREPADALSRLPKKQQELFLRIQQHQKEAETSQNANVNEDPDEDDSKADVNWYSSDEEEPEPIQETEPSSLLSSLLRTLQTTTSNVPSTEPQADEVPTLTNPFSAPSIPAAESDPLPIVDASQLANIDLSDEVTKLLSSIMKTDTTSSSSETISNSLPSVTDKDERLLSVSRKPFESRPFNLERTPAPLPRKVSVEDVDFRFPNVNLITGPLFGGSDTPPKDIDLRQLPFKPIPVHDAANEIDASITSHPPMEYKLTPLPFIARVNYASMNDVAKICANDPRFKRKAIVATETTSESQIPSAFNPNDPRYLMGLKGHNETAGRVDPRLADPRNRVDPRLDGKQHVVAATAIFVPDQRLAAEKEATRAVDFRDPRLTSRGKFPEPMPYAAVLPQPAQPACPKEVVPLRKEDPRLRFRANQNV